MTVHRILIIVWNSSPTLAGFCSQNLEAIKQHCLTLPSRYVYIYFVTISVFLIELVVGTNWSGEYIVPIIGRLIGLWCYGFLVPAFLGQTCIGVRIFLFQNWWSSEGTSYVVAFSPSLPHFHLTIFYQCVYCNKGGGLSFLFCGSNFFYWCETWKKTLLDILLVWILFDDLLVSTLVFIMVVLLCLKFHNFFLTILLQSSNLSVCFYLNCMFILNYFSSSKYPLNVIVLVK